MKTSHFEYILPSEQIAQEPAARRDASRLLVLDRARARWEHKKFTDLPDYLAAGDLLVTNDTRVIPARLLGTKAATGGSVELLLVEEVEPGLWETLMKASRRPRPGSVILLCDGRARAEVLALGEQGRARVRISSGEPFADLLDTHGITPLPPYIHRGVESRSPEDRERYQTVYARVPGAVAAPTAGLHFTEALFHQLDQQGVQRSAITLHVGPGTFRPVSADKVEDHVMDAERYVIPDAAAAEIAAAKQRGGRVVAVGSTVTRTLEAAGRSGPVHAGTGRTDLFIRSPYAFQVVDALLTNFHLPCSTLLMMVCAFAGYDLTMAAYREAVEQKYRFFSYGDGMLIV